MYTVKAIYIGQSRSRAEDHIIKSYKTLEGASARALKDSRKYSPNAVVVVLDDNENRIATYGSNITSVL